MANLLTLEQYKTLEGLTSEKDAPRYTAVLTSVSALVKAYCNNSFVDYVTDPKVETFNNRRDVKMLFLRESPIIAVTSVVETSETTGVSTTLTSSDYYLDDGIDALVRNNAYWAKGPASVVVTYTAGYTNLPSDLEIAVANLVTYYIKEQFKTASQNIASTSLNIAAEKNEAPFPGHIKRVLDLYRIIL